MLASVLLYSWKVPIVDAEGRNGPGVIQLTGAPRSTTFVTEQLIQLKRPESKIVIKMERALKSDNPNVYRVTSPLSLLLANEPNPSHNYAINASDPAGANPSQLSRHAVSTYYGYRSERCSDIERRHVCTSLVR